MKPVFLRNATAAMLIALATCVYGQKAKYADDAQFSTFTDKIVYPEASVASQEEGDVILSVTVTSAGKLQNVAIDQNASMNFRLATMTAFSSLQGDWVPATEDGAAVDKDYKMVFRFRTSSPPIDYRKSADKAVEKGKLDKGIKLLTKAIDDNPFDRATYLARAELYTQMGMEDEANADKAEAANLQRSIFAVYGIVADGATQVLSE